MNALIDSLPAEVGDMLLDRIIDMLGETYVVKRESNGKKVFAVAPDATGEDRIRLFYPPQGGGTRPVDVTVTRAEAERMIEVLGNAIDYAPEDALL